LDFTAQVRVCPGKVGFCFGAFALLVSIGLHCGDAEAAAAPIALEEIFSFAAWGGFCVQARLTAIDKRVRTNQV
jgi:hypothetical protein